MNCQSWLCQIIPIIQPPTPSDDEFKTADKVECIGFLLGAVGFARTSAPSLCR